MDFRTRGYWTSVNSKHTGEGGEKGWNPWTTGEEDWVYSGSRGAGGTLILARGRAGPGEREGCLFQDRGRGRDVYSSYISPPD